ncbi:unnamed protein product [Caenorhabditis sp. 36 PRJEB53466]|nr:unnamed protein product [Caenorhabditis sp. 36 PRJEB53466]
MNIVLVSLVVILNLHHFSAHFIGKEHWDDDELELCDHPELDEFTSTKDALCYSYIHKFHQVNVEVLNWFPALIVYRNLLKPEQVEHFLDEFEDAETYLQTVHEMNGSSTQSDSRRANGSFFEHDENEATYSVFSTISTLIPGIDFEMAEPFSTLSYHPGGHYAPHFDYLTYDEHVDSRDFWAQTMGNRMATLIVMLREPLRGGATVFPHLRTTVRLMAGDAVIWFNMRADGEREPLSLHGGCPIYEGHKIITTLWIHENKQKIAAEASADYPISFNWLQPGYAEDLHPIMVQTNFC